MRFSVIIPIYNPNEDDLIRCIKSVQKQFLPPKQFEIILIDDCSTNWFYGMNSDGLVTKFLGINVIRSSVNGGPGSARNIGIEKAKGDWLIFLDSDDKLTPDALDRLITLINENPDLDAIGYDFALLGDDEVKRRKDGACLTLPRHELLKEYLSLHMDGSVIYTAVKRSLVLENKMRFRDGFHEDVDFLFQIYLKATKIAYLPEIIYIKNERPDSITGYVSVKHIDGFIGAWLEVNRHLFLHFLYTDYYGYSTLHEFYKVGVIGVVATRAREIINKSLPERINEGLQYLYQAIPKDWHAIITESELDTQYARAAKNLILDQGKLNHDAFKKTWSCTDIQGSLFLAPSEVRTCCKRFFVDGEIRGDVKLVDATNASPDSILAAKKSLVSKINKGEPSACSGCNFMEFKEWKPLERLEIKYLSMENHSICNMKCAYCDDTYYGGKKAEYDVGNLVVDLDNDGAFENLHTVVWGGGEPTIGKDFAEIIDFLKENTNAKQRVLTNSLKYQQLITNMLGREEISIVTSVDAGTQETFTKVRGMGKLETVLNNLQTYSAENPHLVTIKYILTVDNSSIEEIIAFVRLIECRNLINCNFQISVDFKQEEATVDQICSVITLHHELRNIGCKVVFVDDLAMQRIIPVMDKLSPEEYVKYINYFSLAANPFRYKSIVLFGKGSMTDWMVERSFFIQNIAIEDREKYIEGVPVLITGSQGFSESYRRALALGVPESLIIKGIIL